jgi:aryl sulfotransferase
VLADPASPPLSRETTVLVQSPKRAYRSWVADSRQWNAYRARMGDIVIATYPKSGTTWMQQIVSLLVFQSPEPRPISEIAPWFDRRELDVTPDAVMSRLDRQTHRRFIKAHTPFDGMPIYDEVKYIHVARDGRDVCLSYHNHCRAFSERALARLDQLGLADETLAKPYPRAPERPRDFFLRWMNEGLSGDADGMPFGSWFDFERTYWVERHRPNLLMVHYRDLKADLDGEMRRVARFLDISVPEQLWPVLLTAASFEEMKRHGNQLQTTVARNLIGGAETFFHKGENDRWKGVLTGSDIAAYEARVRERLEQASAAWLQAGRLGGAIGVLAAQE